MVGAAKKIEGATDGEAKILGKLGLQIIKVLLRTRRVLMGLLMG